MRDEGTLSKRKLKESKNIMSSTSHGRQNISINVWKPKKRIQKKIPILKYGPNNNFLKFKEVL